MTGTRRARLVPVERIQPGDRVVLPNAKVVVVQRVDRYMDAADGEDGRYIVRWAHGPRFPQGHGHRLAGEPAELGSLVPMKKGDEVRVDAPDEPVPPVAAAPKLVPYNAFPEGY